MRSYPTLEPVIIDGSSFVIERLLDRPGDVEVGVGDTVTPGTVIARSTNMERSVTLYVANELGIETGTLAKYITKSTGSAVEPGEVIARVRRGLRTTVVKSPESGTLAGVDEASGTVTLRVPMPPRELRALVQGRVQQIMRDHGAVIQADGTRIYGILGFGAEAIGPIVAGVDRADRELTADHVQKSWKDSVVLAGMTLGVPALNRLKEVGVAGVVAGSISESDIRRFLSQDTISRPYDFWNMSGQGPDRFVYPPEDVPFVIVLTEGFGRRPMADPVFDLLRDNQSKQIAIAASTRVGVGLARPEMYLASDSVVEGARLSDEPAPGRQVRIVDPSQVGLSGACASETYIRISPATGMTTRVVDVNLSSGQARTVPVANVEVLS